MGCSFYILRLEILSSTQKPRQISINKKHGLQYIFNKPTNTTDFLWSTMTISSNFIRGDAGVVRKIYEQNKKCT